MEAKGHVQLRRYVPRDPSRSPFQVFNFYLASGAGSVAFAVNGLILQSLLSVDNSVPTFVGGDMNFVERPSDTTSSHPKLPTAAFSDGWDAFKAHFPLEDTPRRAHVLLRQQRPVLT